MTKPFDLAVIGAGPAGLAAAATAVRGGLRIALIDAGSALGGQFWRQPAPVDAGGPRRDDEAERPADGASNGPADGADHEKATRAMPLTERETASLHHDLDTFHQLRATLRAAEATGQLALFQNHHVWTISRDGILSIRMVDRSAGPGNDVERIVLSRRLILATGAFDRQLPFPGWDLPGVMTAGGLQALLKANAVSAGARIAIGGTGPFLLPVAAGLAERGADVVGVFESAPVTNWSRHLRELASNPAKLIEGAHYAASFVRHRVPYRSQTMIVEAHGTDRVEAVTVARLSRGGAIRPGGRRRVAVDAVGVGWGFTPQLDLAVALGCELRADIDRSMVVSVDAEQMTSVSVVFAAGELCGVGGSQLAVREGQLAGEAVCRSLGLPPVVATRRERQIRAEIARLRRFAVAMHTAHPVPAGWSQALRADTTICRCEEVPYSAVVAACEAHGARDSRQIKQLTRAGMGWCQGRICGFAADCLAAELNGEPMTPSAAGRSVAVPVRLGALAATE
ncbi:NAD(P)/FAD-dependent oxidoreductase [Saxibacter everestensis]|uniref:NAD(P)/FAD-dependent oxidoreductase n=1 Tax=Saxibacter everestensis TaxID=2909229 RepID=A0ABY8QRE6_9MICO|nr:NAD(P)/FAD-dependent oxidoreductase [Brevibacteriaceae bacterium ZFBP1038]